MGPQDPVCMGNANARDICDDNLIFPLTPRTLNVKVGAQLDESGGGHLQMYNGSPGSSGLTLTRKC